jgi:hypothetical protein
MKTIQKHGQNPSGGTEEISECRAPREIMSSQGTTTVPPATAAQIRSATRATLKDSRTLLTTGVHNPRTTQPPRRCRSRI